MKEYFKHMSRELKERIRLIAEEFSHPGMKGASNEEIIRQFLARYLPKKFAIGQGKVVDFSGNESKQIDIIIYDSLNAIPFYIDRHNVIIPVESVYAVIEIKSNLDKKRLQEALLNAEHFYKLDIPSTNTNLPIVVENTEYYINFPKVFVLGLKKETSLGIKQLMDIYIEYVKKRKIRFPFVSYCGVVDEGYFIDIWEENESRVYHQDAGDDTLLFFLLSLVEMSKYVVKPTIRYDHYLNFYRIKCTKLYRFKEVGREPWENP